MIDFSLKNWDFRIPQTKDDIPQTNSRVAQTTSTIPQTTPISLSRELKKQQQIPKKRKNLRLFPHGSWGLI
ncbi:hypothetical protein A1A1_17225 [Planococcus antarcticus DSM 14505]|uniref:Uncharacterized protein n=1 Tax=Planococcus antarcticus DSM 14505 TaxID=1185653 RepID=A0AA87LRC3_9BACL|nr:hypothetical protein A1A1_17225 [Planococcus antarcticus DSM 14505]